MAFSLNKAALRKVLNCVHLYLIVFWNVHQKDIVKALLAMTLMKCLASLNDELYNVLHFEFFGLGKMLLVILN